MSLYITFDAPPYFFFGKLNFSILSEIFYLLKFAHIWIYDEEKKYEFIHLNCKHIHDKNDTESVKLY